MGALDRRPNTPYRSTPRLRDSRGQWRAMRDGSGGSKIFAGAGHSLMETPSRTGMAPGVFAYLREWLAARVRMP